MAKVDDVTKSILMTLRLCKPFIVATGRGRRASVWMWHPTWGQGAHGINLTARETLSGIAEARKRAELEAERMGLILIDKDDLAAYMKIANLERRAARKARHR